MKNKLYNLFIGIVFSFKLLWKCEKLIYWYLCFPVILSTVNSFVLVLFPQYLLDNLTNNNIKATLIIIVLFCIIQLVVTLINAWIQKNKSILSEKNRIMLKRLLVEKLATLRTEQIENPEILTRYEFAQKCIDKGNVEGFVQSVFSIISSIVVLLGITYILHNLPIWVWLIIISVVITNIIGHIHYAKNTYSQMTEETPTERKLYYFRGRLLNKEYAKEIRTFQLSDYFSFKTGTLIEDFFKISKSYDKKNNRVNYFINIMDGVQTFGLYFYTVTLFFHKMITIGVFTSNISALNQFSSSLNVIFTELISMMENSYYLRDYRNFVSASTSYNGKDKASFEKESIIEFVNVSFRYPGQDTFALENINITIHEGEKISIVGANGAGKSTFAKLLLGMYKPTSGKILLNGKDIEEIDPKLYLNLFSSVMQDYQLYSFTILDNLFFKEQVSSEDLDLAEKALEQMGLDNAISKLPDGIDSYLTQRYSERGIELSGGENQKLSIARALCKEAKIIILDEPTSALSPQGEYDIYTRFSTIIKNKTVLFISHRMASCTLCDRILVFDNKRILLDGPHKELIKADNLYSQMFNKQSSLYVD